VNVAKDRSKAGNFLSGKREGEEKRVRDWDRQREIEIDCEREIERDRDKEWEKQRTENQRGREVRSNLGTAVWKKRWRERDGLGWLRWDPLYVFVILILIVRLRWD